MRYRARWCDCSGSTCGLYFSSINFWIMCYLQCLLWDGGGKGERLFVTWYFWGSKWKVCQCHNCCSKADEWGKAVVNTSVLSFSFSSFIKPFGILQLAVLGLTERFMGISTCFVRLHLVPWWLETGFPEAWGIIFISTISVFSSALGTVNIDICTESLLNPIMVLALPSSCGSKFHNPITDYVKIYFLLLVLSLALFTQTLFPFCSDLYKEDFKIFPF